MQAHRPRERPRCLLFPVRRVGRTAKPVSRPLASTADRDHHDHAMPTSGRALDAVALSATLHCLTGCALGEIAGMIIGTAVGLSNWATVALAVVLAFLFGYALTSLPLLRAGLALAAVITDPSPWPRTRSALPSWRSWITRSSCSFPAPWMQVLSRSSSGARWPSSLAVAGVFAFPVNRWLIARGKGHTAVHETGIQGWPADATCGRGGCGRLHLLGLHGLGGRGGWLSCAPDCTKRGR